MESYIVAMYIHRPLDINESRGPWYIGLHGLDEAPWGRDAGVTASV